MASTTIGTCPSSASLKSALSVCMASSARMTACMRFRNSLTSAGLNRVMVRVDRMSL